MQQESSLGVPRFLGWGANRDEQEEFQRYRRHIARIREQNLRNIAGIGDGTAERPIVQAATAIAPADKPSVTRFGDATIRKLKPAQPNGTMVPPPDERNHIAADEGTFNCPSCRRERAAAGSEVLDSTKFGNDRFCKGCVPGIRLFEYRIKQRNEYRKKVLV